MNENASLTAAIVAGRVLLGLCFIGDGILNLASYDVRIAYLDLAGAAHFWNSLAALTYIAGGLLLVVNRAVITAVLALGGMLILMTVVLHSDYSPGTIGEFPPELRGEVNFKETAVHAAMLASLMLVFSVALSTTRSAGATIGANSWILPVGGILLGLYFVINGCWQWHYYDIRVEHIVATGGNPLVLPFVIGVQIVFGLCVVAGFKQRWFLPVLMTVIVLSTVAIHGDLSPTAPYPPNAQIHQWFVKGAILAGLLLLFGLGRGASQTDSLRTTD
jgi:uncharacterized membrane protein YphA (DoxX/SURF4 family)|tara:strand:+ start:5226 stop:6050 length:825 start_codon:yes stop_codon:yes gene_type:complete